MTSITLSHVSVDGVEQSGFDADGKGAGRLGGNGVREGVGAGAIRAAFGGRNGVLGDVTAGGDFNFRVDGFRYPNFRTLTGQVALTF